MYCTVDDLRDQSSEDFLIRCTDDAGVGAVDQTIVEKKIADAQTEIDSYCRAQYTVPFQVVPGLIKKLAVDIALYNLVSKRGLDEESPDAILVKRYRDAVKLLENLANLFRAQLRDGSQASTLGQEIEWAQEYIAIEQIRMGHTRLQVMWQHNAPDDAQTPHLFLQPLLENAVFHGIESTHRPGCINVYTSRKNHWLYLRIENPSIPPDPSKEATKPRKGNSMALQNLKERLSLMYDNDAVIKSQQLENIFRVDIRLPYRPKASSHMSLFD